MNNKKKNNIKINYIFSAFLLTSYIGVRNILISKPHWFTERYHLQINRCIMLCGKCKINHISSDSLTDIIYKSIYVLGFVARGKYKINHISSDSLTGIIYKPIYVSGSVVIGKCKINHISSDSLTDIIYKPIYIYQVL